MLDWWDGEAGGGLEVVVITAAMRHNCGYGDGDNMI